MTDREPPKIPLPKTRYSHVKSATLHVIALVQMRSPVNRFTELVRCAVQRLKSVCPTMGRIKIAETLLPCGVCILAKTTVGRILKDPNTQEVATSAVHESEEPPPESDARKSHASLSHANNQSTPSVRELGNLLVELG